MRQDIEKLLVYLGRLTVQVPALQVIVGYLLADPGRVQFVNQLPQEGALAMAIQVHRRIEIPLAPWQGLIRGVPISEPLAWIQAARSMAGEPIHIRLSTDDSVLIQQLNPLIGPERKKEERAELERRMAGLRGKLDRTLDLYNEVRHIMEVDQERQEELGHFLTMAEAEMKGMGNELKLLKERLQGQ